MPDVLLILVVCAVLPTLALGLPLLLKPDSVLPDVFAFGVLAVAIPAFIWATGAYWIILPLLALLVFVAWLETHGKDWPHAARDALAGGAAGTHGPSRLRLRLWRATFSVQIALVACFVILSVAGAARPMELIVPWMAVAFAATFAFRVSFFRASRCDQPALPGEAGATE